MKEYGVVWCEERRQRELFSHYGGKGTTDSDVRFLNTEFVTVCGKGRGQFNRKPQDRL